MYYYQLGRTGLQVSVIELGEALRGGEFERIASREAQPAERRFGPVDPLTGSGR